MGGNSSHDKEIDEKFLSSIKDNTHFRSKEIREWYEKFQRNFPKGVIDLEDFRKMFSEMTNNENCQELADYFFSAYDKDHNGVIDFKEFMFTLSTINRGDKIERLSWVFDMYDIDGTGTLTREEIMSVLKAIYRMKSITDAKDKAVLHSNNIFIKLDRDSDGFVTKDEFCQVASKDPEIEEILNSLK